MTWAINSVVTSGLDSVTSLLSGPVWILIGTLLALTILWFIVRYVKGLLNSWK